MFVKYYNSHYYFIFKDENEAEKYRWLFPEKFYKWVCYGGYYNAFEIPHVKYHMSILGNNGDIG